MAKTKKVHFKGNIKLNIKQNQHNKISKKTNYNCVVNLNNIDHLLRKYKISHQCDKHHKQFHIEMKIRNNKLTVRNQKISVESHKNQFDLELKIKNDGITFKLANTFEKESAAKPNCDEKAFKTPKTQLVEIGTAQMRSTGQLPRSKTIAEIANDTWKRCKIDSKSKQIKLDVGQYVMAKMKSFSPWPARVTGFTKNRKKVYVHFYGTHDTGSIEVAEITLFEDSKDVIRIQLLRSLDCFAKGIREIETELGIPDELSITNRHFLNEN